MLAFISYAGEPTTEPITNVKVGSREIQLNENVYISNEEYTQILNLKYINEMSLMCRQYDINVLNMGTIEPIKVDTSVDTSSNDDDLAIRIMNNTEYLLAIYDEVQSKVEGENIDANTIMNAAIAVFNKSIQGV